MEEGQGKGIKKILFYAGIAFLVLFASMRIKYVRVDLLKLPAEVTA